jgi:hypothetical protein
MPGVGNGIEVRFVFSRIDECNEIIYSRSVLVLTIDQSYLDAHPEDFRISSAENLPSGLGTGYSSSHEGTNSPALAFEGTVTRTNGVYVVDVTFTGGTPPPDLSELIAAVEDSSLPPRQKRPLLATLEAARASFASGDCENGLARLRAFQNKVQAQLSDADAALRDALLNGAQAILDAGCN